MRASLHVVARLLACCLLATGLAAGVHVAPAAAQEAPAGTSEPAPPAEPRPPGDAKRPELAAVEARRDQVAAERAELAASVAAAGGADAAEPGVAGRLVRLERLERALDRQIDALARAQAQATLEAELDRQLAAGPQAALNAEPPYSLERLDQLLDAEAQERARRATLARAVTAAEQSLAEARRSAEEREVARRAAKEALGAAADDVARAEAERTLRLAELTSEVARERVVAEELALANARRDLEVQRKSELALAARIAFVEERLALDEEELAARLAEVEQREFAVRDAQGAATLAVQNAERRLAAVQKRADAHVRPPPELAAELELRRFQLLAAQRRVARLEQELERLADLRRLRQARWRVLTGEASRDDLRVWTRELPGFDADRERERRQLESRLADLERERAALAERVAPEAATAPGEEQRWLAELLRLYDGALEETRAQLAALDENERASLRLARALGVREKRATFADRAADAADALAGAWSKELIAVEDNPITIGKVVTAILVFGLGIGVARVLAAGLAALVRRRSALDEGALSAIQSLATYALVALFFLIALRSVNIPLTAFTVAGGALAIGIGFGSQAIVNNFVSGLILMVERPIKVGDTIVYDGAAGRVERIGPRSTRIRTIDNVHLIVPNSRLLENNVVNWTLADDVVRMRVTLGVVYGTPTRDVEALLLELMAAQPEIEEHPRPTVIFEDWAADSLRFSADFWVRLSPLIDERVVRSNLRHAIDAEFRRRGIVLAYPMRDQALHLAREPGAAAS